MTQISGLRGTDPPRRSAQDARGVEEAQRMRAHGPQAGRGFCAPWWQRPVAAGSLESQLVPPSTEPGALGCSEAFVEFRLSNVPSVLKNHTLT